MNIHFSNILKYWEHDLIRKDIKKLYKGFFHTPVPNSVHDLHNRLVNITNREYPPMGISIVNRENRIHTKYGFQSIDEDGGYGSYMDNDVIYKQMMTDFNDACTKLFNKHGIPLHKIVQTTIKRGDCILYKSVKDGKYKLGDIVWDDIFNAPLSVRPLDEYSTGTLSEDIIVMNYGKLTDAEKKEIKNKLYLPHKFDYVLGI